MANQFRTRIVFFLCASIAGSRAYAAGEAYYSLMPCRILDTRELSGPFGGPALASGQSRTFHFAGQCGIPRETTAVVVNLTAVTPSSSGHITAFPTGSAVPTVSTVNFGPGQTRTNNSIIPLASDGSGTIDIQPFVSFQGEVHLVADVMGYFAPEPITVLASTSPLDGEVDIAATRETILQFSDELDPQTVNSQSIHAESTGPPLTYRIYLGVSKKTVTIFYLTPLPASSSIEVNIDGSRLRDKRNRQVDADFDGEPGGIKILQFVTVNPASSPGTAVCGRVVASELQEGEPGSAVDQPLAGVTISVEGSESTAPAVSDANGNFCLDPAPASRFFVKIDGRTASNGVPPGGFYPTVGKAWDPVSGEQINIGTIYLPLVVPGTLQPVSTTQATTIHFPPSVLAKFPEFSEVQITVPAGALFADDGSPGGMAGIAPVPPDRIPGRLPSGLEFPVVMTVQTDGASNFDPPAPVCFPNLPNPVTGLVLVPGEKSALWSFNHDAGRWETVGSMTVSSDGTLVCSDPGNGLLAPGWHGALPGSSGAGGGAGDDGGDCPGCENDVQDLGEAMARCLFSSGLAQAASAANRWLGFGIPVVQCLSGIGRLIGSINDNCGTSSVLCNWGPIAWNTARAGFSCYPGPIGRALSSAARIAECGYNLYNAEQRLEECHGSVCPPSPPPAIPSSNLQQTISIPHNLFAEQQDLSLAGISLFDAINGSPKWSQADPDLLQGFSDLFSSSLEDASPGGLVITAGERSSLLAVGLSAPLTPSDTSALIDRFNLISSGQLPATERNHIAELSRTLVEATAELQSRGWQTIWDGFLRGPARIATQIAGRQRPKRLFYRLDDIATNAKSRGRLGTSGLIDGMALRSRAFFRIAYLDPESLRIGFTGFYSGPNGALVEIPRAAIQVPTGADVDGDGVSDQGEDILGTDPSSSDTDGDGVPDGTEVLKGNDPLGRNISIGQVVSGAISRAGEIDRFSFFAMAGQVVYFDNQGGGNIGINWTLTDELGRQVFSSPFFADFGRVTLSQGGAYSLTMGSASSSFVGAYQFQIWNVPPPDQFTISIGDTVSDGIPGPGAGRIESPGRSDIYTFTASPGQVVFFDLLSGGSLALDWTLRDDLGALVFTTALFQDFGNVTLTRGGTYRMSIGSSSRDFVGTYSLKLWNVPPPDQFTISIGDTVSDGVPGTGAGRIESPGRSDIYTFTASPGQVVFFDLLSGGSLALDWTLRDDLGALVFTTALFQDFGNVTLTRGGTYRMSIGSNSRDFSGIYSLKLWNVPPPDQFTISVGDTVSDGVPGTGAGRIESPGRSDIYTFTASPGQVVFFDLLSGGSLALDWTLRDDQGALVFTTALFQDFGNVTLTRGGTYRMSIGSNSRDFSGIYSLKLWNVPPPDQLSISIGDTVSDGVPGPGAGRIESPGVKDIYSFAASAGAVVLFDLQLGGTVAQSWKLTSPTGSVIFDQAFFGDAGPFTLPITGTYRLTVGSDGSDRTGAYRFRVSSP